MSINTNGLMMALFTSYFEREDVLTFYGKCAGRNPLSVKNEYFYRTTFVDHCERYLNGLKPQFSKDDWAALFTWLIEEKVESLNLVFVNLVQNQYGECTSDFATFQAMTGIYQAKASEGTLQTMLDRGEVWPPEKHAHEQLLYIFQSAKALSYIQSAEAMFRSGDQYNVVAHLNPHAHPYKLPEHFPFSGEWYDWERALSYAVCWAFDLFILEKEPDYLLIQDTTCMPFEILHTALEMRDALMASM